MITYLKIIVIVLGVMIAAGVAVIGIKLVEKNDELAELGEDAGRAARGRGARHGKPRPRFRRFGISDCPRAPMCAI